MSQADGLYPESPDPLPYLGNYRTPGSHNTLELRLNPGGSLGGHFSLGGESLEVRSIPGPAEGLYGILLDPQGDAVAIFRARISQDTLMLELDIPGPQPDFSEAETLEFVRVKAPLEKDQTTQEIGI